MTGVQRLKYLKRIEQLRQMQQETVPIISELVALYESTCHQTNPSITDGLYSN